MIALTESFEACLIESKLKSSEVSLETLSPLNLIFGGFIFFDSPRAIFSNGRLPPENGSVRPQTWAKCASDNP